MLSEERDSFSQSEEDIGVINDLELDIKLKNDNLVQKNYLSIPHPLYPEVKHYLKDLLNKKFIARSNSPYSSSVMCVRKKRWFPKTLCGLQVFKCQICSCQTLDT